ncbi:MAG: glycosyltransferase family 4 protein [Smithellaceae bacterium]
MRLLVECTYVYDHPWDNSGIQRVVRNIVSRLGKTRDIGDAVPVILKNNNIYEVKKLVPGSKMMEMANRLHYRIIRARERYWTYCPRIGARRLFQASLNLRRALFLLFKLGDVFLYIIYQAVSRICRKGEIDKRIVELTVRPDDVLILLDSSWHSEFLEQVEELKAQGVTIVSVIYDLIPITHPQFCDEGLVVVFERWFKWVSQTADGFIAISQTIRDQAESYMRQRAAAAGAQNHQWFEFFHLGSELDFAKKNGVVRQEVKIIYHNGRSVYLMVGTIEPRKNHAYLLDAFDLLWQQNLDVTLCFVGKVGWKCDALIQRVQSHKQYNRRLFMFNDLSDTELEFCYRKSRSLVFPAFVEGFGLPLVEAMQRGLPAMASDIPVFREVGGDFVAYFELEKPETLAALIRQNKAGGVFPASKPLRDWSWLNWDDSAKQFLTRIASLVTTSRDQKSQDELKNNHE